MKTTRKRDVVYWRSVAVGLFAGYLIMTAVWVRVCLWIIESH